MKCIILGATGLVGQQLLQQALANPEYSQVIAPTRKTLPPHAKLHKRSWDRDEELYRLRIKSVFGDKRLLDLGIKDGGADPRPRRMSLCCCRSRQSSGFGLSRRACRERAIQSRRGS